MNLLKNYKFIASYIYPNKIGFIRKMNGGKVLDIGCGNHSPTKTKNANPSIYYVGVDIHKYHIDDNDLRVSDEIYFFDVENYFEKIRTEINHSFDYIICAHVIEHVPDKEILFRTIKQKLATGGKCFMTTPNINSINFPSTSNTLNYYDDKTHLGMPITFQQIYDLCSKNELRLTTFRIRNRTFLSYTFGFLLEPFRILLKKSLPFTWNYWGFEDLYIIENIL